MQIVICAFNAGYWKSYFVWSSLIGCVCMSACRPPQGEEKVKLLSGCRFLTYGPIIYLQTNLMMYTCGCNVLTADSTSERVISLTIVSAYRPIHCGENFLFNCLFLAGYLVICLTDQCNVERNVSWLRLWAGFPLSILSYCLCGETCSMLCLSLSFHFFC